MSGRACLLPVRGSEFICFHTNILGCGISTLPALNSWIAGRRDVEHFPVFPTTEEKITHTAMQHLLQVLASSLPVTAVLHVILVCGACVALVFCSVLIENRVGVIFQSCRGGGGQGIVHCWKGSQLQYQKSRTQTKQKVLHACTERPSV